MLIAGKYSRNSTGGILFSLGNINPGFLASILECVEKVSKIKIQNWYCSKECDESLINDYYYSFFNKYQVV